MPAKRPAPPRAKSQREQPIVVQQRMNPVLRTLGLASGTFLTACVLIMMLGKLTDITGVSEGWQYTFITLAIVSGGLNLLAWSIVDSTG